MSPRGQASGLLLAWIGALIGLSVLWVRSPWTGPGPMFLSWSGPAAALFASTWIWLGRLAIEQVPRGRFVLMTVLILWAVCGWLAVSGVAAEMVLDADILRQSFRRRVGIGLQWLPGIFGLALSVAGLAAALEARYRVRQRSTSVPPGGS